MNRDDLIGKFKRYENWTHKETENGTLLIGNPYKDKPFWWLIHIFPKVQSIKLKDFSDSKLTIPQVYRDFLEKVSNGILLFFGTLALEGIREDFSRSLDVEEPFSLITSNIKERPKNAKDSYFFFGSYNWDGSQLYIDTSNNHVYLAKRYTLEIIYEWNLFEEFINSEIPRICSLYDENGEEKEPDSSTLPIE